MSAVLLIVIFPGFELHFLAWIALVPLFLLLARCGPLKAFLSSLAVGLIFYGGLLWWLVDLEASNALNVTLVILGNASYLGVFGVVARYFDTRIPQWNTLTYPALWVVLEYVRSNLGFLAFPWGVLGYSQYDVLPVARVSAFTGVYGVSFLIVTVNTLVAGFIGPRVARALPPSHAPLSSRVQQTSPGIRVAILILSSAFLLAAASSFTQERPASHLTASLVQGNLALTQHDAFGYRTAVFSTYQRLTLDTTDSRPDLIVWPESSVPGRIPYDRSLLTMLSTLAQNTDTFLLVGATGHDKLSPKRTKEKRIANSAFLFSPRGELLGRYDKIWLLPFNEYLPLRGYVKWPSWIVSDMIDSQPGEQMTVFATGTARFGVLICWENLFPDLFRKMAAQRVDFIVSMTNEAFTSAPAARHQMLAMNAFRAIENHVSIVRIASTGVSAVIEPSGRIVGRIRDRNADDVNIEGTLVRQIALTPQRTFYNRYGDLFVYGLFVVVAGLTGLSILGHPSSLTSTDAHAAPVL